MMRMGCGLVRIEHRGPRGVNAKENLSPIGPRSGGKRGAKPLPDGRLIVTHDEEVPIDRRSQGVTLFLKKAPH